MTKFFLLLLAGWLGWGTAYAQAPAPHATNAIPPGPQFSIDQSGAVPIDKLIDSAFHYVDLRQVPSGLLLEHGYSSLNPALYTGGTGHTDTLRDGSWRRLYAGMYRAVLPGTQQRLPDLATLDTRLAAYTSGNTVPLTILHYAYHSIDTLSVRNGQFTLTNGIQLHDAPRLVSPYLARTLFAVAPAPSAPEAGTVTLQLQANLYFTNAGKQPSQVTLTYRAASGQPATTTQSWNGQSTLQVPVSLSAGRQNLRLRLTYTDGSQLESDCLMQVRLASASARYSQFPDRVVSLTAARSLSGTVPTTGTLSIKYGCGNQGKLRKPLLIVEGFDPKQFAQLAGATAAYTYATFYGQLDAQNRGLKDLLDNSGYDLVFLNLDNAGDYIQNNAYLTQAALDWINAEKATTGSTEPNVMLGLSMGGLVARYALADMEHAGRRHQTAKYISFDSPHQGAYVPVGFQCALKHLASLRIAGISLADELPALRTALEIINLPATKQLLSLQAIDFNGYGVYYDPNQVFNDFQREYKQLGYPAGDPGLPCRNVAISNGSQVGVGQLRKATGGALVQHQEYIRISGDQNDATTYLAQNSTKLGAIGIYVVSATLQGVFGIRGNVEFIVNGLPNQQYDRVYGGRIKFKVLWIINTTNVRRDVNVSGALPIETAPGGYQDLGDYIGNATFPFTTISATRFCYIPTVSALDIRPPNNSNLSYNIVANNVVANNQTPFSNVTGPDRTIAPISNDRDNDFHLTFTDYNNRLLRQELLPTPDFTGNEALNFNGSSSIVTIANTNSYVNDLNRPDFTVEAFLRADPAGNPNSYAQTIFSSRRYNFSTGWEGMLLTLYGNELLLQLHGTNYYGGSVGIPVTLPNDGNCHHVAVVRDVNYRVHFYIDGQEASYSPTTNASPYSAAGLSIGGDRPNGGSSGQEYFQGMIGEVRVWNAVRSTAQIQQSLATKLAAPQYGLVAYYDMQDASSSQQVSDLSAVNSSGSKLSPGLRGFDTNSAADDPTWLLRCDLPCTVQGNFRTASTAPHSRAVAPDTVGRNMQRPPVGEATTALNIVPNPATQVATLYFAPVTGTAVTIRVLSIEGQERLPAQKLSAAQAATGRYALTIQNLRSGTYLVVVEGVNGKKFSRLQVN